MPTITASDYLLLQHMTIVDVPAIDAEVILDHAIDLINLYSGEAVVSNLSGTAGSKSLTVSSRTRGAIYHVARIIYATHYTNPEASGASVQGATIPSADLLSIPAVLESVKEAAQLLREEINWSRLII